ncbi:hypothetical protein, partial [Streptococcus pseudopneumoniae]|uniref:hypothetical protein n=1 Tax=Streptococcus pseudopneumoniae TaxID=257758 RepID=UPI0019D54119
LVRGVVLFLCVFVCAVFAEHERNDNRNEMQEMLQGARETLRKWCAGLLRLTINVMSESRKRP